MFQSKKTIKSAEFVDDSDAGPDQAGGTFPSSRKRGREALGDESVSLRFVPFTSFRLFSRMIFLLAQDQMEVDDGVIAAATAQSNATEEQSNAASSPSVKS